MNIGDAIGYLKRNAWVARLGWNGKGMYLYLNVPGNAFHLPHVMMKTADNQHVPWLCSQTDLLAEDWVIVPFPDDDDGA